MRAFILTGYQHHGPIFGNWYQLIHHAREAITEATWNNWKKLHAEFFESLKSWDNQNLIMELYQTKATDNDCQLIAELTREGTHPIENGKQQTINSLLAD